METTKKVLVKVLLDPEVADGIKLAAARDSRDEDHIVNIALKDYLKGRAL